MMLQRRNVVENKTLERMRWKREGLVCKGLWRELLRRGLMRRELGRMDRFGSLLATLENMRDTKRNTLYLDQKLRNMPTNYDD